MPKTVTQRVNALEQKLASDLGDGPPGRFAVCHERIASLERRVEDRIQRGRIWNQRFKDLEAKVRTVSRGAQMLHDEDSRFSNRVLSVVRDAKVKRADARAHCFGRFLGSAVLLVLAGFSVYGIGHALGWVS